MWNIQEEADRDQLQVNNFLLRFITRYKHYFLVAGPLCLSSHRENADRRWDDDFPTFKKYNKSLINHCEEGQPGILEITPNTSWPDIVYYNSFTQSDMGWKIHIVDNFKGISNSNQISSSFVLIVMIFLLSFKQFY